MNRVQEIIVKKTTDLGSVKVQAIAEALQVVQTNLGISAAAKKIELLKTSKLPTGAEQQLWIMYYEWCVVSAELKVMTDEHEVMVQVMDYAKGVDPHA